MAYTADQIRAYADPLFASGGLPALMTAAQQYGVTPDQLASAYGLSTGQGETYLNDRGISVGPDGRWTNMGSTDTSFTGGADEAAARAWAQGLVGGDLGSYNGGNTGLNVQVLGTALANGRNIGDVQQLFPQFSAQQITDFYNQNKDAIYSARDAVVARQGQQSGGQPGGGTTGGGPGGGSTSSSWGPTWDSSYSTYTPSPYLDGIISDLTTQSNNNLTRNILPQIQQDSVAMGGVGGSKEGIAQGLAIADSQRNLDGVIANARNTDFQNSQNRNLQRFQGDQTYALGQGNLTLGNKVADNNFTLGQGQLDLTRRGQDMGFYSTQRGQDITGAATGAQIYNLAQQGGWAPFTAAGNTYSQFTGLNPTTTQTSQQGGGGAGFVGGAAGTYQLGKNLGWWS